MTQEFPVRLRMNIAYDGTDFSGWAKQPGLRTVQGVIEDAVGQLTRSEQNPQLTVGGRTDAGVHARGQVAHVDVTEAQLRGWLRRDFNPEALDTDLMTRRLNGLIKRSGVDARVLSIALVSADFDARFSAAWRRYEYRIADSHATYDPLARLITTTVSYALDDELLQRASDSLLGLRDFSSFCKPREGASSIRTLQHFSWVRDHSGVLIGTIQADAFCHSMVRALVGAVTAVAAEKLSERELSELVEARERTSRFKVMPAHGLSLEEIGYPPENEFGSRQVFTRARRD